VKGLSKIQIDHQNYQGAKLHNDVSKLIEGVNANFTETQRALDAANATIAAQAEQIASLMKRVAAVEAKG
jgi:uncharacterized protein HemX